MNSLILKIRDHYFRDIINQIKDIETSINVIIDSPKYIHIDTAGFNGIMSRKAAFNEMERCYKFNNFIETGTYLGDTTGYIAVTTNKTVYSCEKNNRLYRLAKSRLSEIENISLYNADSREFLKKLSEHSDIINDENFIYLDAHWGKDIPLKEEIHLIAANFKKFIIMIDDFKVPYDSGYTHDKYGTLKYIDIAKLKNEHNLRPYFPTTVSSKEPHPPTGFLVLAKDDNYGNKLNQLTLIKKYEKR